MDELDENDRTHLQAAIVREHDKVPQAAASRMSFWPSSAVPRDVRL
jgi:hypothetical protein